MIKTFHEVANIFPMMSSEEYDQIKADIAANGLLEAVWLHPDGSIIDGRNRYNACLEMDVEPKYRTWDGTGSLVQFVVSLNLHRRHLDVGQRACVALEILPMLEKEAKERQLSTLKQYNDPVPVILPERDKGDSRDHAAELVKVGGSSVQKAKNLKQEAPDLFKRVASGGMKLEAAAREVKERKREVRREENRQKVAIAPTVDAAVNQAKFATIVIDPPWDWGDEGDNDQLGRARPTYETMGMKDLLELPVSDLADVDCHLYLWITNRSLPKGFILLEKWGFRYITCITWVKPSFGMGNYFRGQTEQILFAVRGSQLLKRKDVGTVLFANRGPNGHSSKPVEFYNLVESCSPGPYLEMFSRNSRVDWFHWGENG